VNKIPFHAIRLFYYRHVMGFKIAEGSSIHLGCTFNCIKQLSIGKNSTINQFCRIDNRGGITIGSNVSISPYVKLVSADHNLYSPFCEGRMRPIVLEDYVFIGTDAIVLGNVTMNRGSALAANSVLSKDSEQCGIYAGTPALLKSHRPNEFKYQADYARWFH
jgi:maltose O-acetyltransferase